MKKVICLFLISFLTSHAAAQDLEKPPEISDLSIKIELDIRKVMLDGKEFAAFTREDANTLLQMRLDLPKIELQLEKKSILLKSAELQIEKTEALVKNALEQKEVLKSDNIRLQEELDSANAWYRSPVFWTIVGAVLGTAATVGITYATK